MAVKDSWLSLGWLSFSILFSCLSFSLLSFVLNLFNNLLVNGVLVAHALSMLVVLLMMESWRLVVWHMHIMSISIVCIMMQIVSSIMCMIEFLMFPLIMNLIDEQGVVVRNMFAWLVIVKVMGMVSFPKVAGPVKVQIEVRVVLITMGVLMWVTSHWFHFENEVARAGVDVAWVENRAVCLESTASFVPSTTIKGVEIVSPMEVKLISVIVVSKYLNVVVKHIPRHVRWIKSLSPGMESWGPEVHSQRLGFVHELYSWIG